MVSNNRMLNYFYALLAQAPPSLFPYAGPPVNEPADPFAGTNYGITGSSFSGGGRYPYEESANTLPNPLGIATLNDLIDKIVNALTVIAVPIVTAMILYGAYKITTSAGRPAELKKGWDAILYASVGFGILLLSNGAAQIIQSLFQ